MEAITAEEVPSDPPLWMRQVGHTWLAGDELIKTTVDFIGTHVDPSQVVCWVALTSRETARGSGQNPRHNQVDSGKVKSRQGADFLKSRSIL